MSVSMGLENLLLTASRGLQKSWHPQNKLGRTNTNNTVYNLYTSKIQLLFRLSIRKENEAV